jgi:copper chaperone
MFTFEVKDMTCGHCSGTISKALKAIDQHAEVTIDLARHLVMVDSGQAGRDELGAAITDAGYTPVPVEAATVESSARGGSCCGRCH